MAILVFKIIHIIFFVAWFAGLFYLGRLFVYHKESYNKPEHEGDILRKQYNLMEWKVYKIICNPAMMITWIAGIIMLYLYGMEWFKANPWLHPKITLVAILTVYHVLCKIHIKKLETNASYYTSVGYRYFNEIPTLFLIAIVCLAVLRTTVNPMMLFGIFAVLILLLFGVMRSKNKKQ